VHFPFSSSSLSHFLFFYTGTPPATNTARCWTLPRPGPRRARPAADTACAALLPVGTDYSEEEERGKGRRRKKKKVRKMY
jgi:hypothetical protein